MDNNKNQKNNTCKILGVTDKIGTCGIPLRADTYRGCSFGCSYCFANNRVIMGNSDSCFKTGNLPQLEKQLNRIFDRGDIKQGDIIDGFLSRRYTIHCGGLSDPFQHCEKKFKITEQFVDLSNRYNLPVLFSTKSDTVYNSRLNPDLHTFQMSVTSTAVSKFIEPNIPYIKSRLKFFYYLKDKGFKVGIRIQPFIPGLTDTNIIEMFKDADHFSIEGIKLTPQNNNPVTNAKIKELLNFMSIERSDFSMKGGMLLIKPETRLKLYTPFFELFDKYNLSYSIADNDLRFFGNNKCCCGDALISKSTTFNPTFLIQEYGKDYSLGQALENLNISELKDCRCNGIFASNRQKNSHTIEDYLKNNYNSSRSPVSPKFQSQITSAV